VHSGLGTGGLVSASLCMATFLSGLIIAGLIHASNMETIRVRFTLLNLEFMPVCVMEATLSPKFLISLVRCQCLGCFVIKLVIAFTTGYSKLIMPKVNFRIMVWLIKIRF
jgi:hypothetical protein